MTDAEVKATIKEVMADRRIGVEGDLLTFLVENATGRRFQARRIARCALEMGKTGDLRVTEREESFYGRRWTAPTFWRVQA